MLIHPLDTRSSTYNTIYEPQGRLISNRIFIGSVAGGLLLGAFVTCGIMLHNMMSRTIPPAPAPFEPSLPICGYISIHQCCICAYKISESPPSWRISVEGTPQLPPITFELLSSTTVIFLGPAFDAPPVFLFNALLGRIWNDLVERTIANSTCNITNHDNQSFSNQTMCTLVWVTSEPHLITNGPIRDYAAHNCLTAPVTCNLSSNLKHTLHCRGSACDTVVSDAWAEQINTTCLYDGLTGIAGLHDLPGVYNDSLN